MTGSVITTSKIYSYTHASDHESLWDHPENIGERTGQKKFLGMVDSRSVSSTTAAAARAGTSEDDEEELEDEADEEEDEDETVKGDDCDDELWEARESTA
jgi:hypothetical protein